MFPEGLKCLHKGWREKEFVHLSKKWKFLGGGRLMRNSLEVDNEINLVTSCKITAAAV